MSISSIFQKKKKKKKFTVESFLFWWPKFVDINANFNIGSSRGLNFLGTYLVVCVVTLHNLNMSLFVFSACRLNNLWVSVTQEIHEHWVPRTMMIPQYSGPILPKPNLPGILVPYFYFAVFPHINLLSSYVLLDFQ